MLDLVNSKPRKAIVVTEQDMASEDGLALYEVNKGVWQTVFKTKAPWFGISALLAVMCFSIAQFLILRFANNTPSAQWSLISPNVCLSVLNSLSNLLVVFAIGNGVAIAWWRKAFHHTATKKKLQKSWAFSNNSISLLKNIRHLNNIALATIMAKVALIDGVLFQKAMGTYVDISWKTRDPGELDFAKIQAFSQTTLPITGYMTPIGMIGPLTEFTYTSTITNWLDVGSGINAQDIINNCNGVGCVYVLNGTGFVVDCVTSTFIDPFVQSAPTSGYGNKTIFSVYWDWHFPDANKNYSSITMNATWPTESNDNTCPTNFTISQCEFRPAVLNYTVAYTNFTSVERSKKGSQSQSQDQGDTGQVDSSGSYLSYSCTPPASAFTEDDPETMDTIDVTDITEGCGQYNATHRQLVGVDVIAIQDIYEPYLSGGESRLAGIFSALNDQFTSEVTLTYNDGKWSAAQTGTLASIVEGWIPSNPSWCNYTYGDPTNRVFTRLNTLMLQTSVNYMLYPDAATDDDGYTVNTTAYQYYKDVYYTIDFRYSYVALGLTFLVVACILPSYWEFWTLEKDVTLEPFEIADSLRDLILKDLNSNTAGSRSDFNEVTTILYGQDDRAMRSRV